MAVASSAGTASRHHPWRAPSTTRAPSTRAACATASTSFLDAVSEEEEHRLARARRRGALGLLLVRDAAALRTPHGGRTKTLRARRRAPAPAFTRLAERIRPVCWGADGGRDVSSMHGEQYLPGQGDLASYRRARCFRRRPRGRDAGRRMCDPAAAESAARSGAPIHVAWLPPSSPLVLSGAALLLSHGIVTIASAIHVDGEWRLRGRRVSQRAFRQPPAAPVVARASFPEARDATCAGGIGLPTWRAAARCADSARVRRCGHVSSLQPRSTTDGGPCAGTSRATPVDACSTLADEARLRHGGRGR